MKRERFKDWDISHNPDGSLTLFGEAVLDMKKRIDAAILREILEIVGMGKTYRRLEYKRLSIIGD